MQHSNRRIDLAQNFLRNPATVRRLLSRLPLNRNDTVLDIGAGDGMLTEPLAALAGRVVAIELDGDHFAKLQERCAKLDNVDLILGDFRDYRLPAMPYKVVANIPFNITAEIIERLLTPGHGMRQAFLILQKETALKFIERQGAGSEAAALWQPWYRFWLLTTIASAEFHPMPGTEAALLEIAKRDEPLLDPAKQAAYARFVKFGYRAWKKDLKTAFKRIFSHNQWKRLAKDARFATRATPSELSTAQWLHLFNYFENGVEPQKQRLIDD